MPTRRCVQSLTLAVCLLVSLPSVAAQPLLPYLVEDLTPGELLLPQRLHWSASVGEIAFFSLTGDKGAGLWRTDGTIPGTHRIYEGITDWHLDPGRYPVQWNGFLYYPVVTNAGTWLYRTDGTTPGTTAVAKIDYWYGGAPCGGKLCFGMQGSRLAVIDGTSGGVSELLSTSPGVDASGPHDLTAVGERVYFNAFSEQDGQCMEVRAGLGGRRICGELWTSDGTVEGTRLLKDILPGPAPGSPVNLFASSGGKLYFAAVDPAIIDAAQAWVSDGTPEGTRMLPTKSSDWLQPPAFVELGGQVFFTNSDGDLFETDGTPEGTRSIRGHFASVDILVPVGEIHGRVLMWAYYFDRAPELWSWDGTTAAKLADIPYAFRTLGLLETTGQVWFVTNDGDMWSTDGTAAGTGRRFSAPVGGGTAYFVAATPSRLYYGTGGQRLYMTDGTEAGTREIDLNGAVPRSTWFTLRKVVNGKFFWGDSGRVGVSDGTAEGTTVLIEQHGREPFEHEGHTYIAEDNILWRTDGTVEGTIRVRDWLGVEWPRPPAFIGNQAIFAESTGPGRVLRRDPDGTLHELGVTAYDFSPFVSVPGGVAFWASYPASLMFTDGTAAGTRTVVSDFETRGPLVPLGTKAIFAAMKVGGTKLRLWVTDFTTEGTLPVKDFPDTDSHDHFVPLVTWRNLSLFRIDPTPTAGVWRSDGTKEGTFLLAPGWFDAVLADGDELVLVRYTSPGYGYEVWTSDGTVAGTRRRDVYPGVIPAGQPFVMPGGGVGVLYSPSAAKEIHIRNHRTKAVQVIDWGGLRGLSGGVGHGNVVFFSGFRGSTGHELWAVRLDGMAPSPPPPSVSIAYAGMAKTTTGLGAVFRLSIEANGHIGKLPSVVATTVDGTLTRERDYVPFTREIVFEEDDKVTLVVPLRHANATGTVSIVLSAPVNANIASGVAIAQVGGPARRRTVRK